MATLDEICPADVGNRLIELSLVDPDVPLRAHQPILISIGYKRAGASGVVLPLVLTVTSGWSRASFRRVVFTRAAPSSYTFTPREGGPHVLRLGEVYHQRMFGTLRLDIEGPRLKEGTL